MPQIGIFDNDQMGLGASPVLSGLTLLKTARNLKVNSFFDDFLGAFPATGVPTGNWIQWSNGAGAAVIEHPGTTLRPGIVEFSTGTTNTGHASLISQYIFANGAYAFGGGEFTVEGDVYIHDLSTALEEYAITLGWSDQIVPATDGCYFLYDRTQSVNWLTVTAVGGARTFTDTGIPVVAGAWIRFRIEINADGSAVTFYLGDVLVATNGVNIPTGDAALSGLNLNILKSVGITARKFDVDWIWLHYNLTTSR